MRGHYSLSITLDSLDAAYVASIITRAPVPPDAATHIEQAKNFGVKPRLILTWSEDI